MPLQSLQPHPCCCLNVPVGGQVSTLPAPAACRLQSKPNRCVGPVPVAKDIPEGAAPDMPTVTDALRNGMSFYESLQV